MIAGDRRSGWPSLSTRVVMGDCGGLLELGVAAGAAGMSRAGVTDVIEADPEDEMAGVGENWTAGEPIVTGEMRSFGMRDGVGS